jgi:MazG family protein
MPTAIDALLATIHTLRAPDGCPWDRKQTIASAAHHLLDEAAELVEATLKDDPDHVAEELADLLFMVCFCCEIQSETHTADFQRVARLGNEKLIRRHPHVFGDRKAADSTESQQRWNEVKALERRQRGIEAAPDSILKDLPASTAPLHQALVYQKNAAEVGFDWPDLQGVWAKLREELGELEQAAATTDSTSIEHEIGDLLFAVVNLARHLRVQPDLALRRANNRFRSRFRRVEAAFGQDVRRMKEASLEQMELAWQDAKNNPGTSS